MSMQRLLSISLLHLIRLNRQFDGDITKQRTDSNCPFIPDTGLRLAENPMMNILTADPCVSEGPGRARLLGHKILTVRCKVLIPILVFIETTLNRLKGG